MAAMAERETGAAAASAALVGEVVYGKDLGIHGGVDLDSRLRQKLAAPSAAGRACRDSLRALALARRTLAVHEGWRSRAGAAVAPAASAATAWMALLLRLLALATQEGRFQPKVVLDGVDALRRAPAATAAHAVLDGHAFHDSLVEAAVELCRQGACPTLILVASDSYCSAQFDADFGPGDHVEALEQLHVLGGELRQLLNWTPDEAAIHFVPARFSPAQWQVVTAVLGTTPRHLVELHAVMDHHPPGSSSPSGDLMSYRGGGDEVSQIDSYLDAYLNFLQVSAVEPALEEALQHLANFGRQAGCGELGPADLKQGTAWRHPPWRPASIDSALQRWARQQLTDFLESLAGAEFGMRWEGGGADELLEDPAAQALLRVGLLYQQRSPPYIRPTSRAFMRCLVRWLVAEKLQWSWQTRLAYWYHRLMRGRSYRHLMRD
eukprot:SM000058S18530  [mRNA]  locus=s58:455198:458726:+ [translate_table: standard]